MLWAVVLCCCFLMAFSHYQPELIRFAKEHNIIISCLPPHTTHESQPLDASVFKPLKQNWQELCDQYMKNNPGKVVTKYQFLVYWNRLGKKTMTPATIMAGFRRCGVYPLNPDAIDCSISISNPGATLESFGGGSSDNSEDEDGENDKDDIEQHWLFQTRFEEGYDLPDTDYLEWLRVHHPESLPEDPLPDNRKYSLADDFSSIDPSLAEGYDRLVDSLTFEALMGYGGDDTFPSLGMLDHGDTGETRSTSAVSESSTSITTPSLTCNTASVSNGSTDSLTLNMAGISNGLIDFPSHCWYSWHLKWIDWLLLLLTPLVARADRPTPHSGISSGLTDSPSLTLSTPGGSNGSTDSPLSLTAQLVALTDRPTPPLSLSSHLVAQADWPTLHRSLSSHLVA